MSKFTAADFIGGHHDMVCPSCNKGAEEHEIFPFASMPDEHRGVYSCPPEWIPNVDEDSGEYNESIDPYPARVAYKFNDGEPTVQVFNGDNDGLYTPCAWHVDDGITYWFCKLRGPKNPCGDSFMRSIST